VENSSSEDNSGDQKGLDSLQARQGFGSSIPPLGWECYTACCFITTN